MTKFNTATTRATAVSPVVTEAHPSSLTYEGAPGYARDTKGELFLLAVSNMVGERTFYEKAGDRDDRFEALIHQMAVEDPDWNARMLAWLRSDGNLRSASLVGAVEHVRARLRAGLNGPVTNRSVIASVLQRADEPGEMLAYWTSRYGRAIPKPIKRGVADAIGRLYTERALLKYDTGSHGFRFGDVIELVHPSPVAGWQGDLFAHALDRRHNRDKPIPEALGMLRRNAWLRAEGSGGDWLDPETLRAAGMTWEAALSAAGGNMSKRLLWEALIPSMGYTALLRNLRNLDDAEVPDEVAARVAAKLADPGEVARSRQFPFRFWSAYAAASSSRWVHSLETALGHATRNVPALGGRTLVLVDTSASMTRPRLSVRSKVTPAHAAALFGVTLAVRGEAVDMCGFADGVFRHEVRRGASVLREVERFVARTGEVGHGTQIAVSLRAAFAGHDRVVVISDMQTFADPYGDGMTGAVPASVPLYGFNLGGYANAAMRTGAANRHEFGALTDATFRMLPLLEAGQRADWPF